MLLNYNNFYISTYVSSCSHIYAFTFSAPYKIIISGEGTLENPYRYGTSWVYLTWKPTDQLEPSSSNEYIRATNTLLIDPSVFTVSPFGSYLSHVFIPYATSIETFNTNWKSNDPVYQQQCFPTNTIIHTNQTLRTYMANHSDVWGEIINNVVADQ